MTLIQVDQVGLLQVGIEYADACETNLALRRMLQLPIQIELWLKLIKKPTHIL